MSYTEPSILALCFAGLTIGVIFSFISACILLLALYHLESKHNTKRAIDETTLGAYKDFRVLLTHYNDDINHPTVQRFIGKNKSLPGFLKAVEHEVKYRKELINCSMDPR